MQLYQYRDTRCVPIYLHVLHSTQVLSVFLHFALDACDSVCITHTESQSAESAESQSAENPIQLYSTIMNDHRIVLVLSSNKHGLR